MKAKLFQPKPIPYGEGPGFWVNRASNERIISICPRGAKLLALFYMLNQVMSEAQARTFPATYADLCDRSGVKLGAIKRHLAGLEYCGVIIAKEQADKASAVITITGDIKLK